MEVYQNFENRDIIEKSVIIKNLVGLDISANSLTAIDAVIDDQITTEPTTIYNVTNSNSLSAVYNTVKWNFYQKSGSTNLESITGDDSASSLTANAFKMITIPRETLKQRVSPSSVSASFLINTGSGATKKYYFKDEPLVSSSGDSLFRGDLKIVSSFSDSTTASSTSIGEVFYNYGALVFRGSAGIANGTLSAFLNSASSMEFGSATSSATSVTVDSFSFKREQQKIKQTFFCRAYNDTFNYSNNPTYRNSDGTIKGDILDLGNMTFVTTVGIYDNNNNLLMVAKVNPVVKKTLEDEQIFKVAITY